MCKRAERDGATAGGEGTAKAGPARSADLRGPAADGVRATVGSRSGEIDQDRSPVPTRSTFPSDSPSPAVPFPAPTASKASADHQSGQATSVIGMGREQAHPYRPGCHREPGCEHARRSDAVAHPPTHPPGRLDLRWSTVLASSAGGVHLGGRATVSPVRLPRCRSRSSRLAGPRSLKLAAITGDRACASEGRLGVVQLRRADWAWSMTCFCWSVSLRVSRGSAKGSTSSGSP